MADVARFTYRHYLVRLVGRSEAAAARLAALPAARREERADASRREAARLSARLDASPLTAETAARVDHGDVEPPVVGAAAPVSPPEAVTGGGWAATLKIEGMPTQDVAAVEYANLLACADLERELADDFFGAPLSVLTALHHRLVAGLVAAERVGQPRTVLHDVHDGAQGTVVYRTPPPEALPGLLEDLVAWLGRGSAGLPALVVAGVVHGRVLEWQPFDAANGRLARTAARLVLRARGVDPDGLAVPERVFAADPLGYHREVAASVRRRDLAGWLEWTGEALVAELERTADELGGGPPAPPDRAVEVAAGLGQDAPLTLTEYATSAGVDRDTAVRHLEALARAGWLRLDPGSQGLRFRRAAGPQPPA